jgi:uncharacterized protein (DUF58 family)
MSQPSPYRFLDPVALLRVKSLELRARTVVEGFQAGLNRSPWHGFSVEFTEYRRYTPGDDLRYLDWKLFARTDRCYVKQFEDETNLRCHLLMDMSRSMAYGSGEHAKADYARTLAATLAYFLTKQRDAVGLVRFGAEVEQVVPARFRSGQMRRILAALDPPPTARATDVATPLQDAAAQIRKRGLVVLLSDFLTDVTSLTEHLAGLRARGHDVLAFQLLDPAELEFRFTEPTLFVDSETGREMYVDPAAVRAEYLNRLHAHLASVETACATAGAEFRRFTTDAPLELALSEFLRKRMHGGGESRGSQRPSRAVDQTATRRAA